MQPDGDHVASEVYIQCYKNVVIVVVVVVVVIVVVVEVCSLLSKH